MGLSIYTDQLYSYSSGESIPLLQRENEETSYSLFKSELRWLTIKSLPIISTHLLHSTLQLITVYTGGHLDPIDLSAMGLGNTVISLSCLSITYGIVSTIETLSSQSWTGSKDKTMLGIHLQRGIIILNILLFFVAILWWNIDIIFTWLGQDPQVTARTSIYLRYFLIGTPAYVYFDAIKKYVQAQGIMHAPTLAIGISLPLYAILNYVLVFMEPFKLGFIGIPIAISLTYWTMLLVMILYIRFVDGYSAWGGFSLECFRGLGDFMRLAIPSIISVTTDWWAVSLSSIAVSYSGVESIGAQYVLVTIEKGLVSIPMGIGTAGSNRVGNNIGKGNARRARFSYYATVFLCFTLGVSSFVLLTLFKKPVSSFFTTNESVVKLLEDAMGLAALAFILDSVSLGSRFVIIGLGRQIITATSYMIVYYLFAFPLFYYVCIQRHLGVYGFWSLYIGVLSLNASISNFYLSIVNWNSEAERVQKRVHNEELQIKNDTQNEL